MNQGIFLFLVIQAIIITVLLCQFEQLFKIYSPRTAHNHRTLYLERRFNEAEKDIITRAAARWTTAVNHIVEFEVVSLPITDTKRLQNINDAVVIISVTPDYPDIIYLDARNKNSTCGFYNDHQLAIPVIALVDERLDDGIYEMVVMHELGHVLGLHHVEGEEGIDQLMYPSTELMSKVITKQDLQHFCQLYPCNANQLQDEEKPLHF